jgi:imidazole glycerol phosphate synthase glutamine amidotransferase subunit
LKKTVVVFDYGSGNVHSAVKALEKVGAAVSLTSDKKQAVDSDGLVIPGVGAFDNVMSQLAATSGDRVVDKRLASSRPVLGICVGMQVMFERGRSFQILAGTKFKPVRAASCSVALRPNTFILFTPTPQRNWNWMLCRLFSPQF